MLWPGQRESRYWCVAKDGDAEGFAIYRRHYSSAKNPRPKIRQFVGPGEPLVLIAPNADALFVWRKFINDGGQTGVNCAVFRNEGPELSSLMILDAMIHAWAKWPGERLYTYVGRRGRDIRHKRHPGYCFLCAGWQYARASDGSTLRAKNGQHILERPTWAEEVVA